MIGRELRPTPPRSAFESSTEVLAVNNLSLVDQRRSLVVKDISFSIHAGEIFGIAGVEGNGQSQLVEILAGLRKPSKGSIYYGPKSSPSARAPRTIAHIPEDRHSRGLVLDFSIKENFVLGRQREKAFNNPFALDYGQITNFSAEMMRFYDVRADSVDAKARGLSGGNQQKIVVGRELTKETDLIIASQPTRGLDVGATEFVHESLLSMRNVGRAILLVSSDLSELLSLADRIGVMFRGEMVAILNARECTEYDLGLHMTGAQAKSA
jgi:simple sugar transport system ATP-binding protein